MNKMGRQWIDAVTIAGLDGAIVGGSDRSKEVHAN